MYVGPGNNPSVQYSRPDNESPHRNEYLPEDKATKNIKTSPTNLPHFLPSPFTLLSLEAIKEPGWKRI
jgi:hypothetical protein